MNAHLPVLGFLIAVLAGCGGLLEAPTEMPPRTPLIESSPTVLPVISPESSSAFVGRSDPTAAALAAEGQPSEESPTQPIPTDASIPINVLAVDGTVLRTSYYGAPVQPAPVIVLVHGEDGDVQELTLFAQALQSVGYNVMLLYLRGYAPSPGSVDWSLAVSDIKSALDTLQTLPVAPSYGVLGQGSGAVTAIAACGEHPLCVAAVGTNPLLSSQIRFPQGVTLPMLLLAGEDQSASLQAAQSMDAAALGEHVLVVYPTLMLAQEAVRTQIFRWFDTHLNNL